ncbi:Triple Functional Domain Protein [Manis pentadactyla]|nr:Triple Functional Domain Protein [Manis pentadactyla]
MRISEEGAEKGGKKVKLRQQPSAGEGGRDPEDGSVRRGSTRPLGVPAAGESSRRPAARTCTAPAAAWAEGAAAPSGGEGDRGGEEAVNSPSVRASPRRAPLPRPRRSRAGPQPAPGPPVLASGRPEGGPVASPEGSGSSRSGPRSREGGSQDLPVITFYAILDPLVNVPTKHYGALGPRCAAAGSGCRLPAPGLLGVAYRARSPAALQTSRRSDSRICRRKSACVLARRC